MRYKISHTYTQKKLYTSKRESTWIGPKNPHGDYGLRPTYLVRLYDEVQVFAKNTKQEKRKESKIGEWVGEGEGGAENIQ